MKPPMFLGDKVTEVPQDFIDEVYNILYSMWLCSSEKAQLATYQLKDVAETCYTQWRDNWAFRTGPISFKVFRKEFIDGQK